MESWHPWRFAAIATLVFVLFSSSTRAGAYDPLSPKENITIRWDIVQWTADGYVAEVTMFNFQRYRHIQPPEWRLGWKCAKREVIWSLVGARARDRGDCSRFKGIFPRCCRRDPTIVGHLPRTRYNMQNPGQSTWAEDPANRAASFQVTVGAAGTTTKTVQVPRNFTLTTTPGARYTCGAPKIVKPTKFTTPDWKRTTQAMMTLLLACAYSQPY